MSTTSLTAARVPTGSYSVDPSHSNVGFEVKHMGIATVRGTFRKFEGIVDATGDVPRLEGAVEVASIDTGDENRDGHLKAPDFFDADQYAQISFNSAATDATEDSAIKLNGEITIKGITKPATLTGTATGPAVDHFGANRLGLSLTTTVDRTAFDMNWNMPLPDGEPALANDVTLRAELTLVAQSEQTEA
jgi:polyisoprenoid-binding protein YceI